MYQEVPPELPWEAATKNAWMQERIHELQP